MGALEHPPRSSGMLSFMRTTILPLVLLLGASMSARAQTSWFQPSLLEQIGRAHV